MVAFSVYSVNLRITGVFFFLRLTISWCKSKTIITPYVFTHVCLFVCLLVCSLVTSLPCLQSTVI